MDNLFSNSLEIFKSDDFDKDIKKNVCVQFPPNEGETPELENQQQLEKVDAYEETKKKTPQHENGETSFEKSAFYSDTIYDQIDSILEKDWRLIQGKPPIGSKALGEKIEYDLYYSLKDVVDKWSNALEEKSDINKSILDLKKQINDWSNQSVSNQLQNMHDLFSKGVNAAERSTGIKSGEKLYHDINYNIFRKTGIGGAIDRLANDTYNELSGILLSKARRNVLPLYTIKRKVNSFLEKSRDRTKLIVRTETAKFANSGLVKAWGVDPEKRKYRYYWTNPSDSRSKKISTLRKAGSPYSYDEIKFLWSHQTQMIDGKLAEDFYNQRCSIVRGEKLDTEWADNRFIGKESEFEETN
jgi:hypothetical protein